MHEKTISRASVPAAANAYISPSWYATQQQTGKVMPTWSYAAAHVYGSLRTGFAISLKQ
ncbi:MAG: hypothetical protein EPN89_07610 [Methylovulum sp.]|nr:MAG: hypothetical protein EPN89_07610 [Methylovulum sp.]